MKLRIGTRGSALALWQARHTALSIGEEHCELVIIKTKGDREQTLSFDKIEGKGFFTKEIEEALIAESIDIAVHSMKDLPIDNTQGLLIGAVLPRASASDLLISRSPFADTRSGLAAESVVGTSSLRRSAQLSGIDPSLRFSPLRGNVPTRIGKLREGIYDAIVLAEAGIERLNADLSGLFVRAIPFDVMLPAPAQGAIAVQIRAGDTQTKKAVSLLNHEETRRAVEAERSFLSGFGGGCHIPLGAIASEKNGVITLVGSVLSADGTCMIRESFSGRDPRETGIKLAEIIRSKGGFQ